MTIKLDIPDDIGQRLAEHPEGIIGAALEALAIQGARFRQVDNRATAPARCHGRGEIQPFMTLAQPYPSELVRIAQYVVWYCPPKKTLKDLKMFLAHLMVYGSPEDVNMVEKHIPEDQFRKVLADAPPGVFTLDAWKRWHERLEIVPLPPLPRRRFPNGTLGPEAGGFGGR
jgi:hypothetical protein